ncbi:MAG TPA: UDP-glucose 4-epimerase GalE [Terriglobales bacterium]|nr:UDP-glucose 4-epimerase GalE [Terriglobales bacterium]
MKILVVGGAGYIGSHTARVLRRAGLEVVIYDNLSTGFDFLAKGFEMVVGDLHDSKKLLEAVKQSDAVMHFAANHYVGESMVNPRKYYRNNVEGGLSLLNNVVEAGKKSIAVIFSSTCSVYGAPAKMPINEDYPLTPVNPYGVSKVFFEQALHSYDTAYGIRYASLRYFNAAGADESGEIGECHEPEPHLIPLALRAAAGFGPELQVYGTDYPTPDGTCVRDYTNVVDLAEAHVKALQHLLAGNPSFTVNLGTGEGSSVKEVIASVEEVTGRKVPRKIVPRRPGDPPALVADPTRARQLLQWKTTRSLRDSVATAWKWMQHRGK